MGRFFPFSLNSVPSPCFVSVACQTKLDLKFVMRGLLVALAIFLLGACARTRDEADSPAAFIHRDKVFRLPSPARIEALPILPKLEFTGGLAFSTDGILYFANYLHPGTIGSYVVGKSENPETFITLTDWMTSYGDRIPRAHGMRIDLEGHLVAAEVGTGKVIRISPEAEKIEVLADSYDGTLLSSVWDVAIGPNGEVYASSPKSGVIYLIRPQDGFVGVLNEGLVRACSLALTPDGRQLVAAEPDASRIVLFNLREDDQPAPMRTLVDFSATGEEPNGLAFDEAGRLYVGLGDAGKIQVFDIVRGIRLRTYHVGGSAESLSYNAGTLYVSGRDGIRSLHLR